ncbi:MAG TPA: toprim domain-containing protein [Chitinophagaceae bacterium]
MIKQKNRYKLSAEPRQRIDPRVMPVTGESPQERLQQSTPLFETRGRQYVESRKIPVAIAHNAGVRFDPDWNGRPAVIVPMHGENHELCSVHGRYLHQSGSQDKMFTIGHGGGILSVGDGLNTDPVIIVEGLFDALSLAVCGYSSVATVGRRAPWLPAVCKGKTVLLAFDGNNPGECQAAFYKDFLAGAITYRLTPPGHCKDWNTALVKRGQSVVVQCLRNYILQHRQENIINS